MTQMTVEQAYDEIATHIASQSRVYSDWYCGITSDINERLFGNHNVTNGYAFRECINHIAARAAEQALLNLGCDGGTGGGDENSVFVYAYLKTPVTRP